MYATMMLILLIFPWSILGLLLVAAIGRRLRKLPVRSR